MKKIIAPVDFSATAENAAIFAGELAAFYGAELWLYHTYEINVPGSGIGYSFISPTDMQQAVEHGLGEVKKKIESALKRTVNMHIRAEENRLIEGLTALCDEIKPDMIVMGLSGKNALTRLVVGSNTIRAIQHLAWPVLAVPPKATFIPVKKIGFACDYKKVVETTPIGPLKKILQDFNANLHVLNIVYDEDVISNERIEESMCISELLKSFKPEYHTVLSDDIAEGINWFAKKQKLDWIVMIPKKHNLTEKIFNRSKTKDLLYQTHIPVLCMHEKEIREVAIA